MRTGIQLCISKGRLLNNPSTRADKNGSKYITFNIVDVQTRSPMMVNVFLDPKKQVFLKKITEMNLKAGDVVSITGSLEMGINKNGVHFVMINADDINSENPQVFIHNAKVIAANSKGDIIISKKSKNGDVYGVMFISDIQTGNIIRIYLFDEILKKAKNMRLKKDTDTLYIRGLLSVRDGVVNVKAQELDYCKNITESKEDKENALNEHDALTKADIFGSNGIPRGKSFG